MEVSIALSKLYKVAPNHKLRHTVTIPTGETEYDEYNEPVMTPSTPKHYDFEVQLEPGRDSLQERSGYDPRRVVLDGLVTKTGWATLTLPKGVGAGSTFPLTFRGKAGTLVLGAAPDTSHPKEVKLLGESFTAVWTG